MSVSDGVSEKLRILEANRLQSFGAVCLISLCVIPRNVWNTDVNMACTDRLQQKFQIAFHKLLVTTGILPVDLRIHVFAVNDKLVCNVRNNLYVSLRNV